jgi:soluble lytic murein transglycosylase-like protein
MDEAAAATASLTDATLDGHILADRYLSRFSHTPAADLATWLARYPDHPDASAIHSALLARLPRGTTAPPPPAPVLEAPDAATPEEAEPADFRLVRNPLLDRTVHERARSGSVDSALRLLSKTPGLDPLYGSQLRAEIARALFTQGRDAEALHLAETAFRQSRGRVGLAGYVGGLAAWRMGRTDMAQPLFERASRAELAPASIRAGASFWAARAHLRNRDPAGYAPWMRRAGEARRTFYGLLARSTLGLGTDLAPARETLGSADIDAVSATPHGLRAFALLQVGQPGRAEAELRLLWAASHGNPALSGSILRVAEAGGLTDFAAELAGLMESADGRPHDDARFPIPTLRPAGGFRMDPAMVYALTRLESNFDPDAVSGAGARGLMQIMPVTAQYVAGDSASPEAVARRLHDPATNLSLGQSYVMYLAQHDLVGGDLIHLLGSYNAGPTSFARMASSIPASDDPLLFIESIPNDETRGFVPRALAYTWIYAARLRLPAPSLDALAAGAWPVFPAPSHHHQAVARLH